MKSIGFFALILSVIVFLNIDSYVMTKGLVADSWEDQYRGHKLYRYKVCYYGHGHEHCSIESFDYKQEIVDGYITCCKF